MGCVSSRIENEERVQICKERKRAAKQLLGSREEFANAIVSYLRALKDTGITLRQFTESEPLELESALPPSPPLPLPPSPPLPPPIDSPDSRKLEIEVTQNGKEAQEEILEVSNGTPPPPSCNLDDLLESSAAQHKVGNLLVEDTDEENWAETKSQFEEDQGHVASDTTSDALGIESLKINDNSLMVTKDNVNRDMVLWRRRRRKTLAGIVKELDDYFLKAFASGKDIAVLVDTSAWNTSTHHDLKSRNGIFLSSLILLFDE